MSGMSLIIRLIIILPIISSSSSTTATKSSFDLSYRFRGNISHDILQTVIPEVSSLLNTSKTDDVSPEVVELDVSSSRMGDDGLIQSFSEWIQNSWKEENKRTVWLKLKSRMNGITQYGAHRMFGAMVKMGEDEEAIIQVDDTPIIDENITNVSNLEETELEKQTTETIVMEGAGKSKDSQGLATDRTDFALDDNNATVHQNHTTTNATKASPKSYGGIYIQTLDMALNNLDDDSKSSSKAFFKSLRKLIESHFACPMTLRLDRCGITPTTCRSIGKGIINRQSSFALLPPSKIQHLSKRRLAYLHLSGNPSISDSGAAALAAALRTAKRHTPSSETLPTPILEELDLSSCNIGDAGAKALAVALESSPGCVRSLDLSNNLIGDEGAAAIGKALISNFSQRDLSHPLHCRMDCINLDNNRDVGDKGAKALAAALECGILKSISLRSCSIRADGTLAFGKALLLLDALLKKHVIEDDQPQTHFVDLSGNLLGVFRPKQKTSSAGLLKSKASATTKSYLNFIGKKLKTGLKDVGLDVVTSFVATGESDDEFEEEEADGADRIHPPETSSLETESSARQSASAPRCGARSFADPFLDDTLSEKLDIRDEIKTPSRTRCRLGLRRCALDPGAGEALAAAIVRARDYGIGLNVDVSFNTEIESEVVSALAGDHGVLLEEMAERYVRAMETLRIAQERAAEAARVAAERAKAEAALGSAAWGVEDEEYDDYSDFEDEHFDYGDEGDGYDEYDAEYDF